MDAIGRAKLALDGLSVGDAFGQCFFSPAQIVTPQRMAQGDAPPAPWRHTDDTEMAICVVEELQRRGRIDQTELAKRFARRYMSDPHRSYGGSTQAVLTAIYAGEPWYEASGKAFGGMGSLGNGSPMRVAPLGAYFAADVVTLKEEAAKSAEVTHFHPEAQAGAVAVALAAAFAWSHRGPKTPRLVREFLEFVVDQMPQSVTRKGVIAATDLPRSASVEEAVGQLGNGRNITCPDTVPLCLWLAARHWGSYTEALWQTASAAGDIDTNCAIVGGIVCLSAGEGGGIPPAWLAARGPLAETGREET